MLFGNVFSPKPDQFCWFEQSGKKHATALTQVTAYFISKKVKRARKDEQMFKVIKSVPKYKMPLCSNSTLQAILK